MGTESSGQPGFKDCEKLSENIHKQKKKSPCPSVCFRLRRLQGGVRLRGGECSCNVKDDTSGLGLGLVDFVMVILLSVNVLWDNVLEELKLCARSSWMKPAGTGLILLVPAVSECI